MEDKIKLLYIDDDISPKLSHYLATGLKIECIEYDELIFEPKRGYESILSSDKVRESNIILIDSRLFENNNAKYGKFTGEEFKIIMKKIFPYVETIVITQNEKDDDYLTIRKYKQGNEDSESYYNRELRPKIKLACHRIIEYRSVMKKMESSGIDKVFIEKTRAALDGQMEYDELKKTDVDNLIATFKEMEDKLNG